MKSYWTSDYVDFFQSDCIFSTKVILFPYLFSISSQIRSPQFEEYNGIWPRDPFTRSSKISQIVSSCFTRPFKFEYNSGRIGNIYGPEDCPNTCINIVRGILNMMQITIKKSQNVYELQEVCFFHSKTILLKGCVLFKCSSFKLLLICIYFQMFIIKKNNSHKRKCMHVCWMNFIFQTSAFKT